MKLFPLTKVKNVFHGSITVLFWAALAVIIILEALVIKGSVDIVRSTRREVVAPPSRQVRINFGVYDEILKRLQGAGSYIPQQVTNRNPFGLPPKGVQ